MGATVLGRPLALLERFDHNAMLSLFASRRYHYWAGTPVMADILGRCPLPAPHPAPPYCIFAGRLTEPVCRAFEARFGVRLRQVYGTTESGPVTADTGAHAEVRSDTAGRALPGAAVRIGEDPLSPFPQGAPGRVWVSSPWGMGGYGFPPELAPGASAGGWWPSPDIGRVDEAGYLTLLGRLDDFVRTGSGHLVNPAQVAGALEGHPGVIEAVVVPVATPAGPVVGVLVEGAAPLPAVPGLRRRLAQSLPPWSRPRVVATTDHLPRLASGRADRRACIAILERALSAGGGTE